MIYNVRMDGNTITEVEVPDEDCSTQAKRDVIRRGIAEEYGVPTHYFRLIPKNNHWTQQKPLSLKEQLTNLKREAMELQFGKDRKNFYEDHNFTRWNSIQVRIREIEKVL